MGFFMEKSEKKRRRDHGQVKYVAPSCTIKVASTISNCDLVLASKMKKETRHFCNTCL